MKVKTIDVEAREWFDKVNGNSYFSATVTVNYGMKSEKVLELPFQYGYGNSYEYAALSELVKNGLWRDEENASLWRVCQENGILLHSSKRENCLKREL